MCNADAGDCSKSVIGTKHFLHPMEMLMPMCHAGELNLYHNTRELETLQSPHLVGKAAILGVCLDADDKRLKHPYTCR